MCTLTDISIIAEWIFFKVTKDLLCLHNSDGSGKIGQAHGQQYDRIWAQAHGRNKIDNIFSMACPKLFNMGKNGLSNL